MSRLVYAAVWLIAACPVFLWRYIDPQSHGIVIRGTNISAGWLLLALSAYNVLRWWSARSQQATQEALRESLARHDREPRSEPPREPDPTFDFTRDDSPEQKSS